MSFHLWSPPVQTIEVFYRYSQRAKTLLEAFDLKPPPKIVEVDIRGTWTCSYLYITLDDHLFSDDGNVIKQLLTRLTHHSTFPNVLVRGTSIGGSDNLQELHATKALKKIFEEAGVTVGSNGPKNL